MKTSRIHELINVIPPQVHIFSGTHGMEPLQRTWDCRQIQQLAQALNDPQFPWAYAGAFADGKLPLPPLVNESAILEAYAFLSYGVCSDDLRGALVLREEPRKLARGLLEALLLVTPTLPLKRIGELCCLPEKVVECYEALFFLVRDRADDLCYRATIAYPNTRQVEFQKGYLAQVDPCDLLKRAAVRGGEDVVLELMGAMTSGRHPSEAEYARIVETNILSEAAWLAEAGLIHQPLRIFDLAIKLIKASKKGSSRAQSAHGAVGEWTAASAQPKPQISVLAAAKAALAENKLTNSPPIKVRKNKVVVDGSSRSSRSFDGQISPAISQRNITVRVGSPDTMVFTQPKLISYRHSHTLQEAAFGERDAVACEAELSVIDQ